MKSNLRNDKINRSSSLDSNLVRRRRTHVLLPGQRSGKSLIRSKVVSLGSFKSHLTSQFSLEICPNSLSL